jgi:hypothetical protein
MEEHFCPDQLLIGAPDTDFCIILALACYIKIHLISNHHGRYLFGDHDDDMEPDHTNSR